MNKIKVAVTGPELMIRGTRGFESLLEEIISSAQKEITIISYLITDASLRVIRLLKEAIERGIKVNIIVNSVDTVDENVKRFLNEIQQRYPYSFCLVYFKEKTGANLHAKAVIVDRKKVLIGSANLSWGGMVGNYELGALIEDGETAWLISKIADIIFQM